MKIREKTNWMEINKQATSIIKNQQILELVLWKDKQDWYNLNPTNQKKEEAKINRIRIE